MLIAVCGLLGIVLTTVTAVGVAIINSRTKPAPAPALDPATDWAVVRERVAVLEQRADDQDATSDTQDHRLDEIERVLDLPNAAWRDHGRGHHHRGR